MKKNGLVKYVGWFASSMAILMFLSFIDQIVRNLDGEKGSIILPFATTINCISWIVYALLKDRKDWPIFSCNLLGAIISGITTITAI